MRVIIIGGGIGGLTAAIALGRKGIDAEVFERSPELREVGAGISLWPNAVKALRKLGLGEALDAIGLVNQVAVVRRADGAHISGTSARDLERHFGGGVIIVHRADLLQMLSRAIDSARIHLGHECRTVEQTAAGVTAAFANGAAAQADVLIGADGLRSVVRAALGHCDPLIYSGYTAWRAIVPFDSSGMIPGETWGCGQRFGMFPDKSARVYWFATRNAPEGGQDSAGGPRADLLKLFAGWHQPVEALIRAAPDASILRNDIYDREPLPQWGRGRITLLGDAAHPMTPNLGQGGCQAIEDALEFAANLARATSVEAALQAYESSRVPRTRSIVLASRRLGRLGQVKSPFLCRLRDMSVRYTPTALSFRTLAPVAGYEGHLTD